MTTRTSGRTAAVDCGAAAFAQNADSTHTNAMNRLNIIFMIGAALALNSFNDNYL